MGAQGCGCARSLDTLQVPPRGTIHPLEVDTLPMVNATTRARKAAVMPDDSIQVDRAWWRGLNGAQKSAAMAHEVAHKWAGNCEYCADYGAGAVMKKWGYSLDATTEAFAEIIDGRKLSAENARGGFLDLKVGSNTSPAQDSENAKMDTLGASAGRGVRGSAEGSLDIGRIGTIGGYAPPKVPSMTSPTLRLPSTLPTIRAPIPTTTVPTTTVPMTPSTPTTTTPRLPNETNTGGHPPGSTLPVGGGGGGGGGGGTAAETAKESQGKAALIAIGITVIAGIILWLITKPKKGGAS